MKQRAKKHRRTVAGQIALQHARGESLDTAERTDVLRAAAAGATVGHAARLFRCAPLGDATWRLLDRQPQEVRNGYWHAVSPPRWNRLTEAERAESIDCLLRVKRPRAALHAVGQQVKGVETTILKRLLFNLATVHDEPVGSFPVDRHDLSDAIDALDGRAGVTREEMASLEYWFIEALEGEQDGSHGIPNLELVIGNDPAFFAKAISLVYERNDDRDQRHVAALKAYTLLSRLKHIPGTGAASNDRQLVCSFGKARFIMGHSDLETGERMGNSSICSDESFLRILPVRPLAQFVALSSSTLPSKTM